MVDDLSSLGQDLISTILAERYDSVKKCVEPEEIEKPQKFCSLARFVKGNDIARRSFKKDARNTKMNEKVNIKIFFILLIL